MRQEYSIIARRGKKGLTWYVRYFVNNRMIPSQWSTRTADIERARQFSELNRERILENYFKKKNGKTLYRILSEYYTRESAYLVIDAARGRKLNENSRKILHGFIVNTFIPFLRLHNIKDLDEINAVVINRFQNYLLLEKKLLPQSINRQICGIKAIFGHLYMIGVIARNTICDIVPLRSMNNKIRGCYSLDEIAGIFGAPWDDEKSYLLCALIYSCGLRNSEIQNLKSCDMDENKGPDGSPLYFISVRKSKTASGVRKVPLHPKLKDALETWARERHLSADDFLFIKSGTERFYRAAKKAGDVLGSLLGMTNANLDARNITFYSGRHFYKTMLNSFNLGDVEELFMGHSVNRNVRELYNHKDKRGEKALLEAARKAVEIIDACLFRPKKM